MASPLDKIKIGFSPLSKNLMVYRMGKHPGISLESRQFTNEIFGAVVEKLMHNNPYGSTQVVTAGDLQWEVTCVPIIKPASETPS